MLPIKRVYRDGVPVLRTNGMEFTACTVGEVVRLCAEDDRRIDGHHVTPQGVSEGRFGFYIIGRKAA